MILIMREVKVKKILLILMMISFAQLILMAYIAMSIKHKEPEVQEVQTLWVKI